MLIDTRKYYMYFFVASVFFLIFHYLYTFIRLQIQWRTKLYIISYKDYITYSVKTCSRFNYTSITKLKRFFSPTTLLLRKYYEKGHVRNRLSPINLSVYLSRSVFLRHVSVSILLRCKHLFCTADLWIC